MTIKVHPIIAGSNAPLEIQFIDAATETELSLTGCSVFSALAKHTDTGDVVAMESVIVTSATLGKLKIEWAEGAFAELGVYALQITCTDATGHKVILPSEAGQLLVKVGAANV